MNPLSAKKVSLAQIEQCDLESRSFHEAGHYIAAQHFGLKASVAVRKVGRTTRKLSGWVGRTYYEHTTGYQTSIIAWAGVLAGDLCYHSFGGYKPGLVLREDEGANFDFESAIYDTYESFDTGDEAMSPTDVDCINSHENPWKTLQEAAQIIKAKRAELTVTALQLMKHHFVGFCPQMIMDGFVTAHVSQRGHLSLIPTESP